MVADEAPLLEGDTPEQIKRFLGFSAALRPGHTLEAQLTWRKLNCPLPHTDKILQASAKFSSRRQHAHAPFLLLLQSNGGAHPMRLVEVVVLMGAHCVSPVQHTPSMTEAGKVQCAAVVERDTESGSVKVTPEAARQDPRVASVVQKLETEAAASDTPTGTTIVPVGAPPGIVQAKPGANAPPPPDTGTAEPAEANPTPEAPTTAEEPTAQQSATPKEKPNALQCKGGAMPKWYSAPDGRRKYRCVKS